MTAGDEEGLGRERQKYQLKFSDHFAHSRSRPTHSPPLPPPPPTPSSFASRATPTMSSTQEVPSLSFPAADDDADDAAEPPAPRPDLDPNPSPPLLALCEDLPDLFAEELLKRWLDPTDRLCWREWLAASRRR